MNSQSLFLIGKYHNLIALSCAICAMGLSLATTAHADVIFEDNFSDGNRDGWYSTSSPNRVISVNDGRLVLPTGGGSGNFLTYFTPTTLAVGESINLTFNFTVSGSFTSEAFRFGLLNSSGNRVSADVSTPAAIFNGYRGYAGFQSMDTNSQILRYRTGGNDSLWTTNSGGFSTSLGTNNASLGLKGDGTTIYNASLTIERTGESSIAFSTTINGVTTIFNDNSASNFTFDTIGIHLGNSAVSMTFDDFVVTAIPEPSQGTILLGLGVVGLLLLYRRR